MPTARENIERHLRGLGIAEMVEITQDDDDRVFGWPRPALRRFIAVNEWPRDPECAAEYHHGDGAEAYREPSGKSPALQIVFHPIVEAGEFVELDLDECAPVDVVGLIRHALEVTRNTITGRKTDQTRIARLLDARWGKETHHV